MFRHLHVIAVILSLASLEARADPCTYWWDQTPNVLMLCMGGNWAATNCPSLDQNCDPVPLTCGSADVSLNARCPVSGSPRLSATATSTSTTTITTTNPNTAVKVSSDATTANSTTIQKTAASSGGSQTESLAAADEITSLGANQVATVGAVFCAQGANEAAASDPNAAADIATCRSQFETAQQLQAVQQKMGKNGALAPDAVTMAQGGTKSTLDEFEKNYGVAPDDFMKRLLGAGGVTGAFQDMLGSKLAPPQVEKLMADAAEIHPDPGKFAVDLTGPGAAGAGKREPASLRAKLKKDLSSGGRVETATPSAAFTGSGKIKPPAALLEDLTPQEGLFAEEKTEELTIFGVVHLKYVAIRRAWGRR